MSRSRVQCRGRGKWFENDWYENNMKGKNLFCARYSTVANLQVTDVRVNNIMSQEKTLDLKYRKIKKTAGGYWVLKHPNQNFPTRNTKRNILREISACKLFFFFPQHWIACMHHLLFPICPLQSVTFLSSHVISLSKVRYSTTGLWHLFDRCFV